MCSRISETSYAPKSYCGVTFVIATRPYFIAGPLQRPSNLSWVTPHVTGPSHGRYNQANGSSRDCKARGAGGKTSPEGQNGRCPARVYAGAGRRSPERQCSANGGRALSF